MLPSLAADRTRIAELEKEIQRLEHSISQLQRAQSQVQQRLDAYKYPVLTLPNEVASEIFTHILPPYPHFPPLIGCHSPALLTQICRQWRDIALGIPALWSFISSYHDDYAYPLHLKGHFLRPWLERSRSYPLSLRLGRQERADDELVEAFVSHRARWEYLELRRQEVDVVILDGPMPLLQHLNLVVDGGPFSIAINEVPMLRTAILNDRAISRVILPWVQLTSLTLLNVYPFEFLPILVQTPNLVYCKLHIFDLDDPTDLESWRGIALQFLESLAIVHRGGPSTLELLSAFVVPALRSFEIPESFLTPNPIDALSAFVSKSGCRLEELHITDAESLVPKASYRQAFPSLRTFSMTS